MEAPPEHDSSKVSGILVVEPLNVNGAHVFLLAGQHSFLLPVSLIHKTALQSEFEDDFQIVLDAKQLIETQQIPMCISTQVHLKWATRAAACTNDAVSK